MDVHMSQQGLEFEQNLMPALTNVTRVGGTSSFVRNNLTRLKFRNKNLVY